MFDPLDDNARSPGTRTTDTKPSDDSLPTPHPSYCPRCGHALTEYTWQSIEGVAFCTACIADHPAGCLEAFSYLGGHDWYAILKEYNGVIWLSPIGSKWRNDSLQGITAQMAFERQYGTAKQLFLVGRDSLGLYKI